MKDKVDGSEEAILQKNEITVTFSLQLFFFIFVRILTKAKNL
jgi:hypothetical protein